MVKKENFYNQKKYYLLYIIIIFSIDLLSKYWIVKHFYLYQKEKIFFLLNIFYIHNYGTALSLLSYLNKWQKWFLFFINIISIFSIIYMIVISSKKEKIISYSFILSGALGNIFDRVFYGYVIDFIDLHINNYHFATFNIADLSIFIGVIIIIINYIYIKI